MFELFDGADQSNLARRLQFGYGSSTPPPAEFCPKMHWTKQSCRSFAQPNPDVDCGVAVERPQGFSIILPRAYVDDDEVQQNIV
jgi:hypothetical protein